MLYCIFFTSLLSKLQVVGSASDNGILYMSEFDVDSDTAIDLGRVTSVVLAFVALKLAGCQNHPSIRFT